MGYGPLRTACCVVRCAITPLPLTCCYRALFDTFLAADMLILPFFVLQELTGEPLPPPMDDVPVMQVAQPGSSDRSSGPLNGRLLPVVLGATVLVALCVLGVVLLLVGLRRRQRQKYVHSRLDEDFKHSTTAECMHPLRHSSSKSMQHDSVQHARGSTRMCMHEYDDKHGLLVQSVQVYDGAHRVQPQSLRDGSAARDLSEHVSSRGTVCVLLTSCLFT